MALGSTASTAGRSLERRMTSVLRPSTGVSKPSTVVSEFEARMMRRFDEVTSVWTSTTSASARSKRTPDHASDDLTACRCRAGGSLRRAGDGDGDVGADGQIANTGCRRSPAIWAPRRGVDWVVNAFQLAVTATLLALRGAGRACAVPAASIARASSSSSRVRWPARSPIAATLDRRARVPRIGASADMAITPAILRDVFPRAQLGSALA